MSLEVLYRGLQERYSREHVRLVGDTVEADCGAATCVMRIDRTFGPDEDQVVMTIKGIREDRYVTRFHYDLLDGDDFAELVDEIENAGEDYGRQVLAGRVRRALEARPFDGDLAATLAPVLAYLEG